MCECFISLFFLNLFHLVDLIVKATSKLMILLVALAAFLVLTNFYGGCMKTLFLAHGPTLAHREFAEALQVALRPQKGKVFVLQGGFSALAENEVKIVEFTDSVIPGKGLPSIEDIEKNLPRLCLMGYDAIVALADTDGFSILRQVPLRINTGIIPCTMDGEIEELDEEVYCLGHNLGVMEGAERVFRKLFTKAEGCKKTSCILPIRVKGRSGVKYAKALNSLLLKTINKEKAKISVFCLPEKKKADEVISFAEKRLKELLPQSKYVGIIIPDIVSKNIEHFFLDDISGVQIINRILKEKGYVVDDTESIETNSFEIPFKKSQFTAKDENMIALAVNAIGKGATVMFNQSFFDYDEKQFRRF